MKIIEGNSDRLRAFFSRYFYTILITLQRMQSIISRKIYLVFLSYRKKMSPNICYFSYELICTFISLGRMTNSRLFLDSHAVTRFSKFPSSTLTGRLFS